MDAAHRLAFRYAETRGWNVGALEPNQLAELQSKFPSLRDKSAAAVSEDLIAVSSQLAERAGRDDRANREQREQGHASQTAASLLRAGSPLGTQHGGPDPMMALRRAILTDDGMQYFMRQHASRSAGMKIENGVLTVRGNAGEQHRFDVRLPKDVHAEVLDGKYLVLHDRRGVGFSGNGFFDVGKSEGGWAVIAPFSADRHGVNFSSLLGDAQMTGFDHPQQKIDELASAMYQREYDAGSREIRIGDRSLLARGPDRDGFCELTSGRSSILIHPETRELKLGRGWNEMGAISTIESTDLANGIIRIGETFRGQRAEFQVELDFQSRNPNRTYDAQRVS